MDDSILDIDEALSDSFCHPSDECFEDIQKIVQQWKQTSSSSSSSSSGSSTSTTTSGYDKTGDKYVDTRTFTRPKKRLSQQYLSNLSSSAAVTQPQQNSQIIIGERKPINLQVGGLVTTSQMQRSYLGDVSPPSSYLMCRSNMSSSTDTTTNNNNTLMGNSLITSGDFSNVTYFMENSYDLSSQSPLNELLSTTFPTSASSSAPPPPQQKPTKPRKTYDELLEEENLLKEISNYNYELGNGSGDSGVGGVSGKDLNEKLYPQTSGDSTATTEEELNNTIRLNSTYLNDSEDEIRLNDVTITKSPKMAKKFNTTFDTISKNMNETLIIDTNIESMSNQHVSLDSQAATSMIMLNETFDCNNQQPHQPSPPPPIPPRPQSTFSKKQQNKILNETYESSMLPPPPPLPPPSSSSQNTIPKIDDLVNRTVNISLSKQKLPSFGSNRTINYSQIGDTEMCEFFDDDDDVIQGDDDDFRNINDNELKLGSFSSFELQSTPIRPTINHLNNANDMIGNISPIIIDTERSIGVLGVGGGASRIDDIQYPKEEFVDIEEKEDKYDEEVLELRKGRGGSSYATKLNNQKNHDSREQDERQSLKNFEEFEKSMSFIKNDKDFEEMLNDFGRNEAVEKESTKMKQSLDLIKKRHSLLNLEKQQEDLKKSMHDNIRMAESIEKSMLTTSSNTSSLVMSNGMNGNGNNGSGNGERLLRRSRLFDDVSPMNKSYTTSPQQQLDQQLLGKTIITSENNLSNEELNKTNDYSGGVENGGNGTGQGEYKLKHRHHHRHNQQNATTVNNVDNQEDLSAAQNPDRFKTIRIIRKPPVETQQLQQVFNTTTTTTIGINPLQNTQFTRNSKLSSYDHNVSSYNQQEDEEPHHENTQDFYGVNNTVSQPPQPTSSMGVASRSIQPPQYQQTQQQQLQQQPQPQQRRPRQLSLLAKRDYSSKSSSVDSLSLKPRIGSISNNQLNQQHQQQQYYQPKSVNNFHPVKSPMGNKSKSIHDLADARRVSSISSIKQQPLMQIRQPHQQPENNMMFRNNKKTENKDTMFKVPQQPIGGGNYNTNAIGGNYQQQQQQPQQPQQQRTLVRRSGLMRPSSGLIRPSSGYYSSNVKPNDETGRFSSSNSLSSSSSKGSIHKIEDDVIETNNKLNITITKPLVSAPSITSAPTTAASLSTTTIITKPKLLQSSIPGGRPSGIPQSSSSSSTPMRKRSGLPRPMSMASR